MNQLRVAGCAKWGLRLAGSLFIVAMLSGCAGITLTVVGDEYHLRAKERYNIAAVAAKTPESRATALADSLRDRRAALGLKDVGAKDLGFVSYAESMFVFPDGRTRVLTLLYQTYQDALIVDGLQTGSFDRDTGELKTVRAVLKDPAKLPTPPKRDVAAWSRVHDRFREYLQQHKGFQPDFVVEEQPVISAKLGVAGYRVRYARRNEDRSLSRFAAIVDPQTQKVHVLYDFNMD